MTRLPASLYVTAAERPWVERRPGVHWKVRWEDGDRKAVLMRYEPGAIIPRHRHLGDEQIFVLEGSVSDDAGTCTAGNYARGAGHHDRRDGARELTPGPADDSRGRAFPPVQPVRALMDFGDEES